MRQKYQTIDKQTNKQKKWIKQLKWYERWYFAWKLSLHKKLKRIKKKSDDYVAPPPPSQKESKEKKIIIKTWIQ